MKKKVAIIVPTHKNKLDTFEEKIIENISSLYANKYDLFFVCPDNSSLNYSKYKFKNIFLDKNNFLSHVTYCDMCLDIEFYKKFNDYEYILINQLDSIILKDELDLWCNKNFSYIGGPSWHKNLINSKKIKPKFFCNGGFSLRKINDFIKVLDSKKLLFNRIDKRIIKQIFATGYVKKYIPLLYKSYSKKNIINVKKFTQGFFLPEDVFWTYYAKTFYEKFITPTDLLECANFALSEGAELYNEKFKITPFGVHGYNKANFYFFDNLIKK